MIKELERTDLIRINELENSFNYVLKDIKTPYGVPTFGTPSFLLCTQ